MYFQCDMDDKTDAKLRLAKAMPVLLDKLGVQVSYASCVPTPEKFRKAWIKANGSDRGCPKNMASIYRWGNMQSYPQKYTSRPGLNKMFAYFHVTMEEVNSYQPGIADITTATPQASPNRLVNELTALLAAVKAAGLTITIK